MKSRRHDDFHGDQKFNKKHYFFTGNHMRQWLAGECGTLKFCLYLAAGTDILSNSWCLSKTLNFSASWLRWLRLGIGTVFRLKNNLNFVFFMLGQWCCSRFIKWYMYLKYRCFLLLREQTWTLGSAVSPARSWIYLWATKPCGAGNNVSNGT